MPGPFSLSSSELRHQRDRLSSSSLTWLNQMVVLSKKNAWLLTKQLRVSLTLIILPLLALLLLLALESAVRSLQNYQLPTYSHEPFVADMRPCQTLNLLSVVDTSATCVSIVYAPGNAFTNAVMQDVA